MAAEERTWVHRLCSAQRIWSAHATKRGPNRRSGPPVHDDLVDRQFTATAPNRLLTDIAEHPTAEGKLFLCSIKDCYSNRIDRFSDTEAPYTSAKCAEISPVVNPFA